MAGGKQTPRQKLIGMMYLVLTALLALNVSVEVLEAFVLVDDGLKQTNVNFSRKVDMVYDDFRRQRAVSPERVEPYYTKAFEVQSLADSLANYILFSRAEMIATSDGIEVEVADTMNLGDMKAKDNYSSSTRYWLVEGATVEAGEGSRGFILRTMIENYKEELINIVPENFRNQVELGLDIEGPFVNKGGEEVTWQRAMFDRQIPVAVATNLSRLVTEVRNAEFDVISLLYAAISAEDFNFDEIAARVVPQSFVVMSGDRFEADVFVAAYDSRQQPEVIMGGRTIESRDGVSRLSIPATQEGLQRYRGTVRVLGPGGVFQEYPFEGEFMVQRPSATISATAMNIFYMGVDNPVSLSVPGIPSSDIEARISGAGNRIDRRGNAYNVTISPNQNVNQNVTITLLARTDAGLREMGRQEFRIRRVPDPQASIAGTNTGGRIPREALAGAPVVARMPEDFFFQMDFRVTSFTMWTQVPEYREWNSRTHVQSDDMERAIRNARSGQRITFENIMAVGDDGAQRNLGTISFQIQ